jgi:hypothetical protein
VIQGVGISTKAIRLQRIRLFSFQEDFEQARSWEI